MVKFSLETFGTGKITLLFRKVLKSSIFRRLDLFSFISFRVASYKDFSVKSNYFSISKIEFRNVSNFSLVLDYYRVIK